MRGLGKVPWRSSQITLHNLPEATQGAERGNIWAWLRATDGFLSPVLKYPQESVRSVSGFLLPEERRES